jgi:predicted nucleic acid-binding protein
MIHAALQKMKNLATSPIPKFLAAALEGQGDFIVSRDPHLLTLKHFHTIQIVEPPAFVRAVRQQQKNRE